MAKSSAKLLLELDQDSDMFTYLNSHLVLYDRANLVYPQSTTPEPDLTMEVLEKRSGEYLVRAEKREVGDDSSSQRCQICLVEIRKEQKCQRLKTCGHYFHRSCLEDFFDLEAGEEIECPYCHR